MVQWIARPSSPRSSMWTSQGDASLISQIFTRKSSAASRCHMPAGVVRADIKVLSQSESITIRSHCEHT